jgi:DNA polymerase-1
MTTSKGQPTGAIYGFTTMLFKIFQDIKPDYIISAFDRKAPTFRHMEYAEYKAGRKKMPDELAQQIVPLKELLSAFNIGILELDGYEADDILGTISKRYEGPDLEVVIFTGDRDALQLASDYTKIMITKRGITDVEVYDTNAIKEKYGLTPQGMIDLKGLMGDASDNIPGVAGVGEKTALKLLGEFKTLENVFLNLDKIAGKKLKENLEQHKEEAVFSKKLATIDRNVPIDINLESIRVESYDGKKIREMFLEFEFNSLLDKVRVESNETNFELPEIKEYIGDKTVLEGIMKNGTFDFLINLMERNLKAW